MWVGFLKKTFFDYKADVYDNFDTVWRGSRSEASGASSSCSFHV